MYSPISKADYRYMVHVVGGIILSFFVQPCLSAVVGCPASNSQSASVEEHIEKAQEAINNKRYKEAKSELKTALKLVQDSSKVYLLLAEVHRREGKFSDAIKYAKEAIKHQPDYPEAYYILGTMLFDSNRLKDAQQVLESGLNKASQYAPLYVLKGNFELATSKPTKRLKEYDPKLDTAIKSYEEAVRLASPNDQYVATVRERLSGLKNYVEFVLHEDDPSYVKAAPLNLPVPAYTEAARRAGEQGVIKMALSINERGEVTSVMLFSHLGYGLDEEAIKAARRLKFSPATKAGKAVPFWSRVEVELRLQ